MIIGVLFSLLAFVPSADASCAWQPERFNGEPYNLTRVPQALPLAGTVRGTRPVCYDTGPRSPGEPEEREIDLHLVAGVPPELAFVVPTGAPDRHTVMLPPGTFPQLRSHPLARHLPPALRPRRCPTPRAARVLAGRMGDTNYGAQPANVVTGAGNVTFAVHRDTTFVGARRRAGQPQVLTGDRVAMAGRICGGQFLADRVRVTL